MARKTTRDYRGEIADLKEQVADLQDENESLQERLDSIVEVASGEEQEETEDEECQD
jgi:predicted RNase H-like nuclease (RuvC/YqgF family)